MLSAVHLYEVCDLLVFIDVAESMQWYAKEMW